MSYRDLQGFIKVLEKNGELKRITCEVSPILEITEITDRISKKNGSALLFENVTGSPYPLLINAMGSFRRMDLALEAESTDAIAEEIREYLNLRNYLSVAGILKSIPRLFRLLYALPIKRPGRGKCQQVIEKNVNLNQLPVLKCWPMDAGRFFTLPLVFTKDRHSGQQNVGMYRMQILDDETTAMHWHKHKDGSQIYKDYQEKGERMPVSVALGCDPAITYAATAPLPKMLDEMMLAGWLRRANVTLVKCITNDIYVPSNAEFVLEGYVDTKEEPVLEGPFGDHTGYYSLADYYPKFHVTCITHRKRPVYPATVVGRPPMEDCYMAKATERIFLPFLKLQIPELKDMNLPLEGVFHNCAILSVHSAYPGCARKVMNAVWGMGQMMYTKLIIVVKDSVDVQNLREVEEAVLLNVSGLEDLVLCEGPLDALDHSSNRALYGTRLGVDATREGTPSGREHYSVINVNKTYPGEAMDRLKERLGDSEDKFVIAVDGNVEKEDISLVMWKLFNNIDGKRDLIVYGSRIGIDATKKWKEEGITREWPEDILMSEDIKELVSRRWEEYGLD
ncbi:4-hydroxy-3-polyprenylbenzoate decarboxylase [Anaerocolumna jejuensis DSM 15929]|uniref:4-hydroxy-3-polyprenylbenzoate decarboxylase n=1 Tax=Anaerocolumna jejuensis DSM 15929 TaxID=1121322 RepID=A0A1M6MDA9_9FIRM|nr:menaquinone biosynthesis decarboxylase [Anaerocolumna jejuensis]SHJ81435.1 4-hydroxy-3-polyprenylbenzoate decarboxylase [Anaerocolumna jejuensis DSM 15929]